jgi:hypothetical protein
MYPLFPYRRVIIQTPLTAEDAARVLTKVVTPRAWYYLFWTRATTGFEGRVSRDGFNINRAIRYRNSFLPVLHGRFRPTTNGTAVDVRMVMHPFVNLFLLFWCVILGIAFFQFATHVLQGGSISGRDWIPFAILIFIYLMVFLSFGFEAERATRMLKETFGAS